MYLIRGGARVNIRGVKGAAPPAGVQGAEPLGGGQGAKRSPLKRKHFSDKIVIEELPEHVFPR